MDFDEEGEWVKAGDGKCSHCRDIGFDRKGVPLYRHRAFDEPVCENCVEQWLADFGGMDAEDER